jgi:pSer/pThr/pTyr-binding forkhead associated (FHA) protein
MEKPSLVIGRGGAGYWVDVKLDTVPDVSREHVRLRHDRATGRFYIKDVSTLGTTVNGEPIPPSIERVGDERRDTNVEVVLPPRAVIGLAGRLVLEFRAEDGE